MARTWVRLDSGFYLDRRLRVAGSCARLIWPHILCLLRQHSGMLSDGDLDPSALADVIGADVDTWKKGIEGLRQSGLLTWAMQEKHRGRGIYQDVEGWVTPNWDEYQPDHRARSDRRVKTVPGTDNIDDTLMVPGNNGVVTSCTSLGKNGEKSSMVPGTVVSQVPENTGSELVPYSVERSHTALNDVERPVPVYVSNSSIDSKKNGPGDQSSKEAVELDGYWQKLSGASPRAGTEAEKKRLRRWDKYLKDYTKKELKTLVKSLSKSPWWRGETNSDGTDVFRLGPSKFLNKPENVEALMMRCQKMDKASLIRSPYPEQYTDEVWSGMTEAERREYSTVVDSSSAKTA